MELPKHNEGAEAHVLRHYNTSPQKLQHEDTPPRDKTMQKSEIQLPSQGVKTRTRDLT